MKLKDWADKTGVKYLTAYRWFKAGTLPVKAYQTDSGTIIVEDDAVEIQTSSPNTSDAMTVFLKKTIEFSKNDSSVEDFAGYVLSNFQLKLIGQDQPKYSRNKPKSEEVQKHFKKFLPSNVEKPVPCVFIPEPEVYDNITDNINDEESFKVTENFVGTNDAVSKETAQGLVNKIRNNDEGVLVTSSLTNGSVVSEEVQDLQASLSSIVGMSFNDTSYPVATGLNITTYADLTPQNYTYSANYEPNSLLGSSLNESPVFVNLYNALHNPGPGLNEKPKRGRPRKKNND